MPKKWTKPRSLFDGKDFRGWEPIEHVENNRWVARNGELVNDDPEVPGQKMHPAANIMTTDKFQDFKLHIEVNCPIGGNDNYSQDEYTARSRSLRQFKSRRKRSLKEEEHFATIIRRQ